MFTTKHITAPATLKADGDEGVLSAVFSTFDIPDSDGDVVRASAFTDGQPVPMVWAHDWTMPIGRGVVKVEPERAVFKGKLWLDTDDGMQAYRKIKNAGDLQEYSWGFRILDAEPGEQGGMPVRFITKAEVFEVSPVLVGANRETYTLSLKSADLKRRLNREQMDRIIAVILEALSADDVSTEDDPSPADAGKAVDPVAALKAFTDGLKTASDEDVLAARDAVSAMLADLGAIRNDLESVARKAADISAFNPRELFRQFQRFESLYGAPSNESGRVAV